MNELGLSPAYSSYVNREDIEDFLLRKPHVVEILNDLAPYLEKKHDVTEICLKHTSNDYYEFDALRVTPRFHTKDVGELIKLHKKISYEFFGRLDKSLTENITFAF